VWAVGAGCGASRVYEPQVVYGFDIDESATGKARQNFGQLKNAGAVQLVTEDGLKAVERLEGPFDYVYLDVESRELGKGIYLDLLVGLYDKLKPGAWVLAHDTCVPPFVHQLESYLRFVRDGQNFSHSISFDIDPFGLELSIL
jgi:predicted O-methyltransferase YrrM